MRALGRLLGVPEQFIARHPFPGPGLAVRIIGDVTGEQTLLCCAVLCSAACCAAAARPERACACALVWPRPHTLACLPAPAKRSAPACHPHANPPPSTSSHLPSKHPPTAEGDRLDVLREVDEVFINAIREWDLYDKIWQAFAVFLPVRSVGESSGQRWPIA